MTQDQDFVLFGHYESGNVYKVALMLALSGKSFRFRHVDIFSGGHRTPQFLEVSRYGEVPALRHGERHLVQSGSILLYLCETLDRFGPVNEDQRWAISEWLFWDNHRLLPSLALTRYLCRFVPDHDPAVLAFCRGRTETALGHLEQILSERPYLTGALPSIADIACAGYAWFIDQAGLDPSRWPAIGDWLARLEALPGWQHPYELLPKCDGAVQAVPMSHHQRRLV
jgi:glutathione S-transferase